MSNVHQRLRIDQPACYRIMVQGRLGKTWAAMFEGVTVKIETRPVSPVTVLTGQVADQAALMGLLNQLYGFGFPLLSVECTPITNRLME